jgi:hypothetical protein
VTDKEIIGTRKYTHQEWQQQIQQIIAEEYGHKFEVAAKVSLHPLRQFYEQYKWIEYLNKNIWERDLSTNGILLAVLRSIELRGQLVAIHGARPESLIGMDPFTKFSIWKGGQRDSDSESERPREQEPGIGVAERESSINEEDRIKRLQKEAAQKADRLKAIEAENAELRRVNERLRRWKGNPDLDKENDESGYRVEEGEREFH